MSKSSLVCNSENECKGSYISNRFIKAENKDDQWTRVSPSDAKDIIGVWTSDYGHVDRAVESAKNAFQTWSLYSKDERIKALHKIKEVFISNADLIAETISRETGKPLWETKTEAKAIVGKINITIETADSILNEMVLEELMPGVEGYIKYKPRGVMAVIGPFNFPAHLPNGHIIPALLFGNTVVYKPSEKTPLTGQLYAGLIHKADLPPGVFNMVQGQGEIGRRIVSHRDVDGILFTGSYDVGLKIKKETVSDYWKILALEMGGKNASVIHSDADIKKALYETVIGGYLTSGQRCSCTSRLYVHENIYDEFVSKLHAAAKKIKIGHWKEDVFMGTLIDESSVEKYLRFMDIASREGHEVLMRGKRLENTGYDGQYVTPSICLVNSEVEDSVYLKSEIFGPNLAVYKYSSLNQAIHNINDSQYGLVASLFSKNENNFNEFFNKVNTGLMNWNRTTNGASSKLPFGGTKKSGNDMPTALFSPYYCTVPVSGLKDFNEFDQEKIMPGMNYDFNA